MPIHNTAAKTKRATKSTTVPAKSRIRKFKKSAPSASSNELHRLPWDLWVLVGDAEKHLSAAVVERFLAPANSKIAFEGKVDQNAYVYVVQVAEPSRTATTYPLDGEAIHAKAGETLRVPAEGWLVVPTKGKLLAFSSPNPLSRKEIIAALAGRDPAPGQAGHGDARPADFGVFADAGGTKASQINPTDPTNPPVAKFRSIILSRITDAGSTKATQINPKDPTDPPTTKIGSIKLSRTTNASGTKKTQSNPKAPTNPPTATVNVKAVGG